jgi:hypothetical protein
MTEYLRTFGEFCTFCACGDNDHCEEFYRRAARLLRKFDRDANGFNDAYIIADFADRMVAELLTKDDLIEHGGGIGGSWLTKQGKEFLALLKSGVIYTHEPCGSNDEREPIDAEIAALARGEVSEP